MPHGAEIQIADFIDVAKRAAEPGLNIPTGFAILPRNFETAATKADLIHEDTTPTIRALWLNGAIIETKLETDGERFPYAEENSFEWVGPAILIGASVYSESPQVISVALGVLSNYLTDYFKGRIGEKKAKFDLIVPIPNTNKYVKVKYEGAIEGIKNVEKIIKDVRRNQSRRGARDDDTY